MMQMYSVLPMIGMPSQRTSPTITRIHYKSLRDTIIISRIIKGITSEVSTKPLRQEMDQMAYREIREIREIQEMRKKKNAERMRVTITNSRNTQRIMNVVRSLRQLLMEKVDWNQDWNQNQNQNQIRIHIKWWRDQQLSRYR